MNLRDRVALALATGLSVGKIPLAPGTFGTLLGIPISFGLSGISMGATLCVIVGSGLAAVWIAGKSEGLLGQKDAACIVIDEIFGIVVAMVGIPLTPVNLTAGFIAFRLLDIIKPFPARYLDAQAPGGWGIVLDDVVAGVYSNIFLRLLSLFLN